MQTCLPGTCGPRSWISELPVEKFFDEQTVAALIELGNALLAVYNRLAVELGKPSLTLKLRGLDDDWRKAA